MIMKLAIDDSVLADCPDCRIGYAVIRNVNVVGSSPALSQDFLKLQNEVAKIYNIEALTNLPPILAVRAMYKKLEFDPARYQPSAEAMVRRVLQHKGVYYVNSAVDANNYCSLKYLMPFGLYDLDKIEGDIRYLRQNAGAYVNIDGKQISTNGKPFLTDSLGVFGNPNSDSRRTAVSLSTKNLLSVVYAGSGTVGEDLTGILESCAETLTRYNGGTVEKIQVVGAKKE